MRSRILFLVLCLSITLVNCHFFPEDSCYFEQEVDDWFGKDFDPMEEEAGNLLKYNGNSPWSGYNNLYRYAKNAIPIVNRIQNINEQYEKLVNEIQTNNGKASDVNLKGEHRYCEHLASEFTVRSHCINKWMRFRIPSLKNKDIDYQVLNMIQKEINEDNDTLNYIKNMLNYAVQLEKKLKSRGSNAGKIIYLMNRIKQEIESKKFGEKTVHAVSLIKRLRDNYHRSNIIQRIHPKQPNLIDIVA